MTDGFNLLISSLTRHCKITVSEKNGLPKTIRLYNGPFTFNWRRLNESHIWGGRRRTLKVEFFFLVISARLRAPSPLLILFWRMNDTHVNNFATSNVILNERRENWFKHVRVRVSFINWRIRIRLGGIGLREMGAPMICATGLMLGRYCFSIAFNCQNKDVI